MNSSLKRVVIGTLVFCATLILAVFGYVLAGWPWMDAIYMVVITVFGVGYGEVHPIESPALRVFTICVIIAGTTSAVYVVGAFIQMVTEGEIEKAIGVRRMNQDIESLRKHVIVNSANPNFYLSSSTMTWNGLPWLNPLVTWSNLAMPPMKPP
jgi:voltage-gated potassium channel